MKHHWYMAVGVAVVLVALCGLASDSVVAGEVSGRKGVVVTEKDNGKTVKAAVGEQIIVRLASNPTTGYQWRIGKLEPAHLKPIGESHYEPPDSHLVGAGGTEVFTFTTLKPGKTRLRLEYVRSWENKPIKTFKVTIATGRGPAKSKTTIRN
jgi:predicted secreted protein